MELAEVQPVNEVAALQARVEELERRLRQAEPALEFLVAHAIASGGTLRVRSDVFATLEPILSEVETKVWQNPITQEIVFSTIRLGR